MKFLFTPLAIATGVFFGPAVHAQVESGPSAAAAPSSGSDAHKEEAVVLTPFEVAADNDHSYGALNSNSITRFNTELDHMPVSADIFDKAFMKDINASSVEDMVAGYSAGAGSAVASPGASASSNQGGDRNANSFLALRGLTAPTMQRDGFMPVNTYIQSGSTGTGFTSNFDIERVEVINGPQSLLYGVGGAGGVINLVSKQARLDQPANGSVNFQVDQYGNKLGLFDYGEGTDNVAVRVAATEQRAQAGRRLYVGGPMDGLYAQLAVKLFGNTVVRLSGEKTEYTRIAGTTNQTFTATSTAFDARNGQQLRYLIATNQLNASANGGASGAGPIDNGNLTWDNVDSFGAWWNTEEYTKTELETMTADTQWNHWLTSQVALGYRTTNADRVGNTITFAPPSLATNPTGQWAIGMTGGIPASDLDEPVRQKAIRFSMLATNDFFGGRMHSQSILGADFVRTDGALISNAYVKADSNFNPTTTNTANTSGYTYAPAMWWAVGSGPVQYPFWNPLKAGRVTLNGVNYVRVQTNVPGTAPTATNPEGLLAGGATALGDYRIGKTINKGVYAANYSNWLDGKLDILLGVRAGDAFSQQATEAAAPSPPSINSVLDTKAVSFNAGADYAVFPWLHPYFSVSDSYDPPAIFVAGPTGQYPVSAKGTGEEIGLKFTNASKTISGSIAFYHADSKNEEASLTSTLLFDINPSGLNGLYGAPSVWINVDRKAEGIQIAATATPNSNWRMRLSAALTTGTVNSTVSFPQLYNDQFYENASGQVTYKDGSVVYVNGTTASATPVASTAATATPLTVAMMSTSTSLYYANPQAVTGAINRSSTVGKLLTVVDPVHGAILTGATGLPISAQQINPGFTPPGNIVTNVAGESSTGYPKFSAVYTTDYQFSTGWLKGLSVGGTASLGWQYRQYYYYPNGLTNPNAPRQLYLWPTQVRFDGIIGYQRKVGKRYVFATQLNISNVFNRYHVLILPNYTSGYSGIDSATFDQQPRAYVWSNNISF